MTAISQEFMRYKISDSYCVFNGEYHDHIKNGEYYDHVKNVQNQIYFMQMLLKN